MIVDPSEKSKQDVLDIALYIAQDNQSSAIRFLEYVEKTYVMLSEFPDVGHTPFFDFVEGLQTISNKGFTSYNVFYRVLDTVIRIDRVSHSSRDLPSLFKLENSS